METFLKKLYTLAQSRRFWLTVVFILVSLFGSDEMVKDREGTSDNIVNAIEALIPLAALVIGYVSLMVSYTSSPTLGKDFFERATDTAVLAKLIELIDIMKPLIIDQQE